LETSADDLVAHDGSIYVPDTNKSTTFKEVARAVYREMGRLAPEAREELEASATYDPVLGTTTSASHIAVIDIDPSTLVVRLEKYVVAEDCGQLINPLIVEGQVHGGVAQGIGAALYEEVVYDEHGQLLTASFVDYMLPTASEVPPMRVVHMETASPAIGGFRGMGEGGTIGAPAAVANAVSDALAPLGIEIDELPVTPERLFQLVRRRQSRTGEAQ
jgi:carbon-monoxide dehydrogenase large subunit